MFAHQLFAHQALATEWIPAYLKLQFLIAAWGQCWLGKLQPRTKSISHADCFHSHPLAPSLGGRLGSDLVDYRSCSSTSLNHTSSKIAWLNPKNGRGRMVRHSRKIGGTLLIGREESRVMPRRRDALDLTRRRWRNNETLFFLDVVCSMYADVSMIRFKKKAMVF